MVSNNTGTATNMVYSSGTVSQVSPEAANNYTYIGK